MSRLSKVLAESNSNTPKRNTKERNIPAYGEDGRAVKGSIGTGKKILAGLIFFLTALMVFLYLPGAFMSGKKKTENKYVTPLDVSSIKVRNNFLSKSSDLDFDDDNIDYLAEKNAGTDPWDSDTDGDGASDYYELYISKTDPTQYEKNLMNEIQREYDETNGDKVSTPYKINNVVLWADDYDSKAHGGVVETLKGYNFNYFSGYAQFPHSGKIYVYSADDGIHKLLQYRSAEDAWYINGCHKVEIYDKPLTDVIEFSFFGKTVYSNRNGFTSFMSFILPSKGFVTANSKTNEDVEPEYTEPVRAKYYNIDYNIENGERFSQNNISLSDLRFVRSTIDEGYCVGVSLFDETDGELRALIYGYTNDNVLLVADENTKEPIGEIITDISSMKTIQNENEFTLRTFYTWRGLGFSYAGNDKISFFAVADNESGNEMQIPQSSDEAVEE